jgi:hypothetical protein
MTDIMQHWKNRRFVVADDDLIAGDCKLVILTEVGYWSDHYEELAEWCNTHHCLAQGMTVEIPNDVTLTLFCLRWS